MIENNLPNNYAYPIDSVGYVQLLTQNILGRGVDVIPFCKLLQTDFAITTVSGSGGVLEVNGFEPSNRTFYYGNLWTRHNQPSNGVLSLRMSGLEKSTSTDYIVLYQETLLPNLNAINNGYINTGLFGGLFFFNGGGTTVNSGQNSIIFNGYKINLI